MELIQLKMPPERLAAMADAVERDINARPTEETSAYLRTVLVWLRWRAHKWNIRHPDGPLA